MQLLDAIIAFTLTMAALATAVTVLMETLLRVVSMRKKNMVDVMRLLNKELGKGHLNMTDEERWIFFTKVVENPAAATINKLKSSWENFDDIEDRFAFFGSGNSKETNRWRRIFAFLKKFLCTGNRAGFYENVSLEYLLCCLAETKSIQQASISSSTKLKTEFNRIARKYEEIQSSVSSRFKLNAHVWPIKEKKLLKMCWPRLPEKRK